MPDNDPARFRKLAARLRVPPDTRVKLGKAYDPADTAGVKAKDAAKLLLQGTELLAEYQARLAAQDRASLLVIIQAMDAGGKDGTIQHVMSGVNPQGVEVTSFKVPTAKELDHDFLWRASIALPSRGMIGIFNRSYYEEMLVVRVHPTILDGQRLPANVLGDDIWKRRFRHINDWEAYLVDQGTTIVKLFLHVSKAEQKRRFLARIDEPEKNWKFNAGDVRERGFWDDYQKAYADVLSQTSTAAAPWYIVPADNKWFMRLAASAVIVDALVGIDPQWPKPDPAALADLMKAREELMAEPE